LRRRARAHIKLPTRLRKNAHPRYSHAAREVTKKEEMAFGRKGGAW